MTLWDIFKTKKETVSPTINIFKKYLPSLFDKRNYVESFNNDQVVKSLSFCTQTVLADYFILGSKKFIKKPNQHFIDGGRQTINISSDSFKKNSSYIQISKPFKIIELCSTTGKESLINSVLLVLKYFNNNDSILVNWLCLEADEKDWEVVCCAPECES